MNRKMNVPIEDRTVTRRTILLVEDDRTDEEWTRRALRKSNVMNEVTIARDGQEALEALFGSGKFVDREIDLLPAVVLLDLKLPKVSGIEVLRRIRSHHSTRRLPVIVLTSSHEDRDRKDVYELGADGYIRKPVDFEKFSEAVGHLGMCWVLMNDVPRAQGAAHQMVR